MDATAIARPYAAAAFAYASENDAVKSWRVALTTLRAAMSALSAVMAGGRLISSEQAAEVALEALAGMSGGHIDAGQKRFVEQLAENDRLFALPEISRQFNALQRDAAGIIRARVESAYPIADRKAFDAGLEKRLGKKVESVYEENPDLLGGARVYINDDVIDGSIRGRLQRLAAAVTSAE